MAQQRSPLLLLGASYGTVSLSESIALTGDPDREDVRVSTRYEEPGKAVQLANAVVRWLADMGISISGTQALRVEGRKSGKVRSVVINVLTVDGVDYVVSPRGNTQWARNVRAAGVVQIGSRRTRRWAAVTEVADAAKPELLRRYLERWYGQVKNYVNGLTPESNDEQLLAGAPDIPVFRLAR